MSNKGKYAALSEIKRTEYFEKHFPHRLILLRTFRIRVENNSLDGGRNGDLYRCAKDACMIAIRLWMDFFCLIGFRKEAKGDSENEAEIRYELQDKIPDRETDVKIYSFGQSFSKSLLAKDERICIAKAQVIASKELAHLTEIFDERDDDEATLIKASEIIEEMIRERLYVPCSREFPSHEACWMPSYGETPSALSQPSA